MHTACAGAHGAPDDVRMTQARLPHYPAARKVATASAQQVSGHTCRIPHSRAWLQPVHARNVAELPLLDAEKGSSTGHARAQLKQEAKRSSPIFERRTQIKTSASRHNSWAGAKTAWLENGGVASRKAAAKHRRLTAPEAHVRGGGTLLRQALITAPACPVPLVDIKMIMRRSWDHQSAMCSCAVLAHVSATAPPRADKQIWLPLAPQSEEGNTLLEG